MAQLAHLDDGTLVTYHGSIQAAHGLLLHAEECTCARAICGYQLVVPISDDVVLRHVRRTSITPV